MPRRADAKQPRDFDDQFILRSCKLTLQNHLHCLRDFLVADKADVGRWISVAEADWYTFLAVGQGLGEGEELGDGVFCAGDAHLDPVAADRNAGGQAGEPAVEGVDGDRDADPGAAGLAKCGQHPGLGGQLRPGR